MNLYPVYEENREVEVVKKGKFYSILYVLGFVCTLVAWTVVVVIGQGGDAYVAKIHPPNYNPSETSELVSRDKIKELQQDEEKKNVKCICSESAPTLNDFASIIYEQYSLCSYIMEKFDWDKCRSKATATAATAAGLMCPGGLTVDEFDNLKTYSIRTDSKGAYAIQHLKSLCTSAVVTMEGLKRSSLYRTVSSPSFMDKANLQRILDRDLESKYLIQMGAIIAANTASLGFGRFNLPLKIQKLNSAQTDIEDLTGGYYALATENPIFGPLNIGVANPASMDYKGNDKYEHFMANIMDSIGKFAKYESDKATTLEPWKSFWRKFRELGENTGVELPKSWFETTPKYKTMSAVIENFFLKKIETGIDMDKYHTACAPKYCEYLEKQKLNMAFLLGIIFGVAGTISAFCKGLCGVFARSGVKKKVIQAEKESI